MPHPQIAAIRTAFRSGEGAGLDGKRVDDVGLPIDGAIPRMDRRFFMGIAGAMRDGGEVRARVSVRRYNASKEQDANRHHQVRDEMGLKPGDRVGFVKDRAGRIILQPFNTDFRSFRGRSFKGMITPPFKRPVTLKEMDEGIARGALGK